MDGPNDRKSAVFIASLSSRARAKVLRRYSEGWQKKGGELRDLAPSVAPRAVGVIPIIPLSDGDLRAAEEQTLVNGPTGKLYKKGRAKNERRSSPVVSKLAGRSIVRKLVDGGLWT
jgi:hypothetical protein